MPHFRTCPLLKGMAGHFKKLCFLAMVALVIIWMSTARIGVLNHPAWNPSMCPVRVSEETITRLDGTDHLLVSAYANDIVTANGVRIISIFKKDSVRPLHCVFCCQGSLSSPSTATVFPHPEGFGYPYVTTAVLCETPMGCQGSHVALASSEHGVDAANLTWLPVRNRKEAGQEATTPPFNFTVCISVLYGHLNNVLQVAQTFEMYRLLGVNKVVVYVTNSGPELGRLLHTYSQEGFVELVPWPIDKYLKPSTGWLFSRSGGDVHYYGQMVTLNECIYRSRERSGYVLLNDLDEIIMPYRHDDLMSMMSELQMQHPDVSEFRIQAHRFPVSLVDPNGTARLPQWEGLPGLNILEHIYRVIPGSRDLGKMIIRPRLVEYTSVHSVLKQSGKTYSIPEDVCRIVHFRDTGSTQQSLRVDRRLWYWREKLVAVVDRDLKRAGLIKT